MTQIMEKVVEFFDGEDWGYDLDLAASVLETRVQLESSSFSFRVFADEETRVLGLILQVTPFTPEERRSTVCEFLVRINWGLGLGCFHMDLRDGEVQYRGIVDLEDGELSVTMVRNLVMDACRAVDLNFPGLMAVTHAGLSPAEASGLGRFEEEPVTATVQ